MTNIMLKTEYALQHKSQSFFISALSRCPAYFLCVHWGHLILGFPRRRCCDFSWYAISFYFALSLFLFSFFLPELAHLWACVCLRACLPPTGQAFVDIWCGLLQFMFCLPLLSFSTCPFPFSISLRCLSSAVRVNLARKDALFGD